ncbi:hypothetical protein A2U01_0073751, partial [Trifolium medium]|nr:hypothetical protein [Trifolium medium]
DGASRKQVLRRLGASVICASHRKDGASRQAVRFLHQEVSSMARCAASTSASRTFICSWRASRRQGGAARRRENYIRKFLFQI